MPYTAPTPVIPCSPQSQLGAVFFLAVPLVSPVTPQGNGAEGEGGSGRQGSQGLGPKSKKISGERNTSAVFLIVSKPWIPWIKVKEFIRSMIRLLRVQVSNAVTPRC